MLIQKVIRHGNSLGIIIPVSVAKLHKIKRGDVVILYALKEGVIAYDFDIPRRWPRNVKLAYKKLNKQKNNGNN